MEGRSSGWEGGVGKAKASRDGQSEKRAVNPSRATANDFTQDKTTGGGKLCPKSQFWGLCIVLRREEAACAIKPKPGHLSVSSIPEV